MAFRPTRVLAAAACCAGLFALAISDAAGAAGGAGGPFEAARPFLQGATPIAVESKTLTVRNSNAEGGAVTSAPAGISCGTRCSAAFELGSAVTLSAAPREENAFAGFHGDCTSAAGQCTLTMDAAKTVRVNFFGFAFLGLSLNRRKGTGLVTFKVGGRGRLVLAGGPVEKRVKTVASASTYSLPVQPRGRALRALRRTGRAKVRLRTAFTPFGGTAAAQFLTVEMRRSPSGSGVLKPVSCVRLATRENETVWRCAGRG